MSCRITLTLSQVPQECKFYLQGKAPRERRCSQEGQAGGASPRLSFFLLWRGIWVGGNCRGGGRKERQRLKLLYNVFPRTRRVGDLL